MTLDEKICRNTAPIPREVCLRAVNLNVLKDHHARQSCIRQAMAKPLPGAAGDAFLRGAVTVDAYTIYEVMPIHLKCLQLVNSPMLDLVTSAVQDGATAKREFECDDEFQLCYIFTENPEVLYDTPKSKLEELIQTSAKAKFRTANSALVNGICSAIVKQFERHIATTVRFASEVEGQTEKKSSSLA
jgi:hypothetical protein